MTSEEHIARAALMGMEYMEWCGIYKSEGGPLTGTGWDKSEWLDAETLEPIPDAEKSPHLLKAIAATSDAAVSMEGFHVKP